MGNPGECLALNSSPAHHGATRIQGRITQILIAFLVMTIPMLLFSSVLLGLIFHYRVTQNEFVSNNLAFTSDSVDNDAYFVNISATTLITVASWSSTVAPILIGFSMTLASYPVAKGLLEDSQRELGQLPTPFQLSLIIQIIANSGIGSLWSWLVYTVGPRSRRESQGRALKALSRILMLGILLSAFVLGTDTWLHITTKTVIFYQVEHSDTTDVSTLGFGLRSNCTNTDNKTNLEYCTLDVWARRMLLDDSPMRVLANASDAAIVRTYSQGENQYAYLANPRPTQQESLDYSARSIAIQSYCSPITSQCLSQEDVGTVKTQFECPLAFEGTLDTSSQAPNAITMAYFTNSTGSKNDTYSNPNTSMQNPYYYSAMTLSNMQNALGATLVEDPEVFEGPTMGWDIQTRVGTIIGLFCNSSVYNLEFSSVNETITRFIVENANGSTTRIVAGTQLQTKIGDPTLLQAVGVAGLSNTAQDFAKQFALAYSQTALAIASGGFEPRPAEEFQTHRQMLVARVPKAPLYCLITANFFLVVLGIALTAIALVTVRGDTKELQARLTITAIVAALLQGPNARASVKGIDDMFDEKHDHPGPRVGFARTEEGGWTYERWAAR